MKNFKELFNQTMKSSYDTLNSFPWESKEHYAYWLAQTYYFTRHSTRLLTLAAANTPVEDEVTHARFLEHIKEETGHENLAIQDLKAMGHDISEFEELMETKIFYNQQYFMTEKYGSVAQLGWIMYLEGIASVFGPAAMQKCSEHHPSTKRFLKVHAEEDQKHIESAFELVESIGADKNEFFMYNFIQSSKQYCSIFEKIKNHYSELEVAA